jgi:branched-chain amino acid transport system ATP-binding protein
MTSPQALAARDLNKRFGSLVVARNITFDLPRGARYALIGPNGAGKTTLINLLTGLLRPDGGQIFLEGADITAVQPAARVKRGLVRTFQINALFPQLSPLEAVTLAVCERRGEAAAWWRPLPAHRDAVEEAYEVLTSVGLAADSQRETRALAYGQQRLLEMALALATRPRVLLLDEPAAGVPRGESAALLAAISALPREITVLFIEHDMELVFRFASRIIVMVSGGILRDGTPEEVAADEQVREIYLGRGGHGGDRGGGRGETVPGSGGGG